MRNSQESCDCVLSWKSCGRDVEACRMGLLVWEAMGRSIDQMEISLVTFEHDKEFFVAADGSRKLHGRQ